MKKICEFEDCSEEGIYPAPKSRDDINNYKYFCIKHIREFNKSWNFFEGLSEEEFESEIRKSTTWDRPSWKFGTRKVKKENINDYFNLFNNFHKKNNVEKKMDPKLISSWKLLDLKPTSNVEEVKKRYKSLAKKWHPDKNLKLNKSTSDMFVKITNAYKIVIKSFEKPTINIS